jgi:hypothetical protein
MILTQTEKKMALHFEVGSYLRKFGVTEDGEDYVGEVLYVQAEDDEGNRWVHVTQFPTVEVSSHPEEGYLVFGDIYEDVYPKVLALKESFEYATTVAGDWVDVEPRYGSNAYCKKY